MSNQQDKPSQPNWLFTGVVLAIVGGVVQIIVNHYDNIVAFAVSVFTHLHFPSFVGTPAFDVANVFSILATIGGALITFLAWLLHPQRQQLLRGRKDKKNLEKKKASNQDI